LGNLSVNDGFGLTASLEVNPKYGNKARKDQNNRNCKRIKFVFITQGLVYLLFCTILRYFFLLWHIFLPFVQIKNTTAAVNFQITFQIYSALPYPLMDCDYFAIESYFLILKRP